MKKEFTRILGLTFKQTRLKKLLTQEKTGIGRSYLYRIEVGKRLPNLFTFWALCEKIHIRPSQFAKLVQQKMSLKITSYHGLEQGKPEPIIKKGRK